MTYYQIVGSNSSAISDRLASMESASGAVVADLDVMDAGELKSLLATGKPVVILNPTADKMSAAVGIGIDCDGAVIHPARDGRPTIISYVPPIPRDVSANELRSEKHEGDKSQAEPSGKVTVGDDPFAPMRARDIAALLDRAVKDPMGPFGDTPKYDPVPEGAAGVQYFLTPTETAYHPKSFTWDRRKKPVVIKDQTATVSVPLLVEVYASPKPANKFLRVTAFGTGFTPGKLKWDNNGERAFFQDIMTTKMTLGNTAGVAGIISEPKTKNNQATYTSSSSITIGIKKSKDGPEPSASATLTTSVLSTLSDFLVLEKSAGRAGAWSFDMQLCGQNSDGKYDVKNPLTLVDWKGKVWELPGLARATLFPACMTGWALPLTCQANVPLDIELFQRLSYVASGWFEKMSAGCSISIPHHFSVNFGAVNVPG